MVVVADIGRVVLMAGEEGSEESAWFLLIARREDKAASGLTLTPVLAADSTEGSIAMGLLTADLVCKRVRGTDLRIEGFGNSLDLLLSLEEETPAVVESSLTDVEGLIGEVDLERIGMRLGGKDESEYLLRR